MKINDIYFKINDIYYFYYFDSQIGLLRVLKCGAGRGKDRGNEIRKNFRKAVPPPARGGAPGQRGGAGPFNIGPVQIKQ